MSISNQNITVGDWFYITVKCFRQCNYSINAGFRSEMEIKSDVLTLHLSPGDEKILKFKVPNPAPNQISLIARVINDGG